jgi:type VI secretion system protein ImpH
MTDDRSVEKFLANPQAYEFFQAIRILARRLGHGESATGGRFDIGAEPARVAAYTSQSFPASDIQSVTPAKAQGPPDAAPKSGGAHPSSRDPAATTCASSLEDGGVPEIHITMLGLTGVAGVLPQYYTQLLLEQRALGEHSLDDFLNIFNHRLAYLYYYAWEKYRFPAALERTGADPLREILLALAGVPPAPLPVPGGLPQEFFARFTALLALQPRSGEALRTILADYFEVPVDIHQYAGAWYRLEGGSLTQMSDRDSISDRLGYGVVAGEDYWSLDSMARIRIGPLSRGVFEKFLPGGEWHSPLREICRFFARDEIAFEIQLVLNRLVVPKCQLEPGSGLQLGWTTWMKSKPFKVDPDDVVFRL